MEIKIATFQKGTPAQEFLPLITDAHNLRYSHAEKNCLYFQSLQNPGPFSPVSRRTTAPRPPAWTPPAPGEPSHFRARPVSHETA